MKDYEKLGVFYLGKEYDMNEAKLQEDLVLYKSKDLTTHAVIIGMTGSGKTGLGISMIEEAALDNIPVIAIDPKGDLGNLVLTFPKLRGEDFRPWINLGDAENKGLSADDYAKTQADLWHKGLEDWGQDGERIERFRNASDVKVYTPGSSTGIGISLLKSFKAPTLETRNNVDAFRESINVTVTGLLSLIGVEGDPFTSREHILLSTLLEQTWKSGQDLELPDLIGAIQKPPFDKIGVMDLENVYSSKDRFALAMMFNNILASPSFKSWMEGEPLNVNGFLYDVNGKPRVSVFSISHLSDSERMFFVTMLLNEVLSWVRSQPGTGSLRAILYMDEIFGYLPPTANPPSKGPLLTLLKQARAFGLGLVLSTQNPVDIDYKALSNAGAWFIGRLQTERDKARVISGLEGAAAGGKFDKQRTEQILAGLGKRIFYLHNVHDDEPVIFSTRWVLSYLAGPLTRDQISNLPNNRIVSGVLNADKAVKESKADVSESSNPRQMDLDTTAPILPPQIQQVYLPVKSGASSDSVYKPSVIGIADVFYSHKKHGVAVSKSYTLITPLYDGPIAMDWDEAEAIDLDVRDLDETPIDGLGYASYPSAAADVDNYDKWQKLFTQYLRTNLKLKLFSSPSLKVVSEPGENERDFRIRLQHIAHEQRDDALEDLKKKYATKINTLEDRQMRARQALEKQNAQASQKKLEAAVSAGTAILGALFGKKSISATSISRVGTAMKSTNRALNSGQGTAQAEEKLQLVEAQLAELQTELEQQVVMITESFNVMDEKFEEVEISATSTNITSRLVCLAWVPKKINES